MSKRAGRGQPPRGAGGGRPRGGPQRKDQRGQRGTTPVREEEGEGRNGIGGEQVEGRHAVRELLLAGTRKTRELVISSGMDDAPILEDIVGLAQEQKVSIRELGKSKFDALARTDGAQGVIGFAKPLHRYELDDLVEPSSAGDLPFLLFLDGVTDPGNLGAILRTAECAGVTGVVLPKHRAARITAAVTKTAAGAVEHLRIANVPGLPAALTRLADHDIWSYGLDAGGSQSLFEADFSDRGVALVMGAEGTGLSRLVEQRCDTVVSIPMRGVLGSLNVANASTLAMFEVVRSRS